MYDLCWGSRSCTPATGGAARPPRAAPPAAPGPAQARDSTWAGTCCSNRCNSTMTGPWVGEKGEGRSGRRRDTVNWIARSWHSENEMITYHSVVIRLAVDWVPHQKRPKYGQPLLKRGANVDHGPTEERTNPKKGSDINRFVVRVGCGGEEHEKEKQEWISRAIPYPTTLRASLGNVYKKNEV